MSSRHLAIQAKRATIAVATAGLTLGLLSSPAAAAGTLPLPEIVTPRDQIISGATIQVSFPPFSDLPAGTASENRTTFLAIAPSATDCFNGITSYRSESRQVAVPFRDLERSIVREISIPSLAEAPTIATSVICAWQIGRSGGARVESAHLSSPIAAGSAAGVNSPALPGTPRIVGGATPTGVPVGGSIQIAAAMLSGPPAGQSLIQRAVRTSIVDRPNVGSCNSGSGQRSWDLLAVGFGTQDVIINMPVGGTTGKYLCLDQIAASGSSLRTSDPLTALITAHEPTPLVNLQQAAAAVAGALNRVQNATRNLSDLLANPNANQQQVAEAIEEAQQAQEELQGAQAAAAQADPNNAVNQQNANGGVIANDPAQQQATDANEQVRQQLQNALGNATVQVAPTINPTLLSLAETTGFDPLVTPVLSEGKANTAGIKLTLKKPKKVKRGKGFNVTLNVDPKATRGGMRQYLLRMDGDQPTLLIKRSGFITTGARSKKYWISPKDPKGTYLILSTFQPSVPGTPGAAIATPITVK